MSTVEEELQTAFADSGYEIGEVSTNRNTVRVVLLDGTAEAAKIREITRDVVDEGGLLGMNVTTESIDGQDRMGTVVSIRQRA